MKIKMKYEEIRAMEIFSSQLSQQLTSNFKRIALIGIREDKRLYQYGVLDIEIRTLTLFNFLDKFNACIFYKPELNLYQLTNLKDNSIIFQSHCPLDAILLRDIFLDDDLIEFLHRLDIICEDYFHTIILTSGGMEKGILRR